MKRLILLLMIGILGVYYSYASKSVTKDGVRYTILDNKTARANLLFSLKPSNGEIIILDRINISGAEYIVTEIGTCAYNIKSNIKSIVIPSTVVKIGKKAFAGCKSIQSLQLPWGSYTIEEDAFSGCKTINEIKGNTIPFQYIMDNSQGSIKESYGFPEFHIFAKNKLKTLMEEWQQKKEYETVEQYKARVTEENRIYRMNEFEKELKEEYVTLFAPNKLNTALGNYDREYEVYTIHTGYFGKIYAKVPKADAQNFRQNYYSVVLNPHFGVQGDTLAILSCDFQLNGKTYTNAENYENNGSFEHHFELPPLDIDKAIAAENKKKPVRKIVENSIDKNIPQTKEDNDKLFILIVGNENYKRVAEVPYAINDANVFAEYCQKTLGVPKKNIDIYYDASINDMRHAIQVLTNRLKAFNGEGRALVYYSGHGYPDESTRMPYLMPVDGFVSDVSNTGYNLDDIYDALAEAPSQLTLLLLDACFSGTTRQGDMAVNAKGVAVAARSTVPTGNLMVFSASQGSETAYVDEAHGHGRFTYYLLKHLRDTKGDTTLGGLVNFVTEQVRQASVIHNDGKTQTPTPNPSFKLGETWKSMKLK